MMAGSFSSRTDSARLRRRGGGDPSASMPSFCGRTGKFLRDDAYLRALSGPASNSGRLVMAATPRYVLHSGREQADGVERPGKAFHPPTVRSIR